MKWMKDFGYVANLKMHKNTNKVLDYASKCVIMNNERVWKMHDLWILSIKKWTLCPLKTSKAIFTIKVHTRKTGWFYIGFGIKKFTNWHSNKNCSKCIK